ncbi:hypothetical protein Slin15195_G071380 [Septoria linicola]|uniref:Uncharacterized protein n=1 Tax=Septoria linicola TaxID=215465 RepID=A0A9Q9EL04_9PEZI|nr:hypothetical protein Slin14017_G104130 [Septoria linicola]USW53819.1 hypothetical protein Slin15195_G071380 [Septoria linicola]
MSWQGFREVSRAAARPVSFINDNIPSEIRQRDQSLTFEPLATGSVGPSGPSGPSGASGLIGATGSVGPSGPSGPPGPTPSAYVQFGYLGCFVQTGGSGSTTGLALPTYGGSYSNAAAAACRDQAIAAQVIYYGLVNTGTTTVDCFYGNYITYITSQTGGLGMNGATGDAGDNNCYPCNGGPVPGSITGACGNSTVGTSAIYARGF